MKWLAADQRSKLFLTLHWSAVCASGKCCSLRSPLGVSGRLAHHCVSGMVCCAHHCVSVGWSAVLSVGGLLCSSLAVSGGGGGGGGGLLLQQLPFSADIDSDPQCKFLGNNNFGKLNSAKI